MSITLVPTFAPSPSPGQATHFWCARHDTTAPMSSYQAHTDAEHDGSPPCVLSLVIAAPVETQVETQADVDAIYRMEAADDARRTAEAYCGEHDIFGCPFIHYGEVPGPQPSF